MARFTVPSSTVAEEVPIFFSVGDDSKHQTCSSDLIRLMTKIKACMLVATLFLAPIAIVGLLITIAVHSGELTKLEAQDHTTVVDDDSLFWLTSSELKKPFQRRLLDHLSGHSIGYRSKLTGQCLKTVSLGRGSGPIVLMSVKGDKGARCSTRFTRFNGSHPAKHGLLPGDLYLNNCGVSRTGAAVCRLQMLPSKPVPDVAHWGAVRPSVTAVDVVKKTIYFSLFHFQFPFECAGINNSSLLDMEFCIGIKDRQLFYLDGDNSQLYKKELKQLMLTLCERNLLA